MFRDAVQMVPGLATAEVVLADGFEKSDRRSMLEQMRVVRHAQPGTDTEVRQGEVSRTGYPCVWPWGNRCWTHGGTTLGAREEFPTLALGFNRKTQGSLADQDVGCNSSSDESAAHRFRGISRTPPPPVPGAARSRRPGRGIL